MQMAKWLKISQTGELRYVDLSDSRSGGVFLNAVYREIGCDIIEFVHSRFLGEHICLMVDACGKLKDGWPSRINNLASLIYAPTLDSIVGDALLGRFTQLDDGEIYAVPCEPDFYEGFIKRMCSAFDDVHFVDNGIEVTDDA